MIRILKKVYWKFMKCTNFNIKTLCIILAVIAFAVAVVLAILYLAIFYCHWHDDMFAWIFIDRNIASQLHNNIGDFLWGTIGILLTFTTTLFLFITFREQREQLLVTKEESDKTRFETTYFNILGMLKQVQETVNANICSCLSDRGIHNLVEYYTHFKRYYTQSLEDDSNLKQINDNLKPITATSSEIEQYEGMLANLYVVYVEEMQCNIGYLYRYIFNAIKFVVNYCYNKGNISDTEHYLNLLQAQLSNEELCFIFYNAISKYGKDKHGVLKFKKMLDKTQFLENIDSSFLLNRNHYCFYSHTPFKFLNRDELKNVIVEG